MKIRVGTWNVQYGWGDEKNRRRLQLLRELDADIWVLTETNDALNLSDTHRAVSTRTRFVTEPGGRWVTIWSRLPLLAQEPTQDSSRTTAPRYETPDGSEITVFGTVLPWMLDRGPNPHDPQPGWSELHRLIPLQGDEWRHQRERRVNSHYVVAGDFNLNLGGKYHYGTQQARSLLTSALEAAHLECLTQTERFEPGQLDHPPINHVCAGAAVGLRLRSAVTGCNTTPDGVRLSDHSGVLAEMELV